jgi:hypothetical protein
VRPGERELRWARTYLSRVAEPPAPALSELVTRGWPFAEQETAQ